MAEIAAQPTRQISAAGFVSYPRLLSALVLGLLLSACQTGGQQVTSVEEAKQIAVQVDLTSDPAPPVRGEETRYTLRLRDMTGGPATGAKVTLMGRMPDGMTVVAPLKETPEPGIYSGRVLFTMEGEWRLTVRIIHAGRQRELSLIERVQAPLAAPAQAPKDAGIKVRITYSGVT